MGFLDRFTSKVKSEPSIEQLEDDLERSQIRSQISGNDAERAEREAIMSELKSKYGKNWKSILGLKGIPSLPSLKSILHGLGNPRLADAANKELSGGPTGGLRKQMLSEGGKLRQSNSGDKLMNTTSGDKLMDSTNGDKLRKI